MLEVDSDDYKKIDFDEVWGNDYAGVLEVEFFEYSGWSFTA